MGLIMRHRIESGFTLLELLVTVAIVAILSAIALPSYNEYIRRGARAEATGILLQNQVWMEQRFTLNNSYGANVPILPVKQSPKSGTAKYKISIAAIPPMTTTSYTLEAVPEKADKCGTLTVNNTGLRGLGGQHTATVEDCWAGR